MADGITDFADGYYYDEFEGELSEAQCIGLEHEVSGTRSRIEQFYLPRLQHLKQCDAPRVLDCGCGNGLSVDLLVNGGIDAWGNDLSRLRRWQWNERDNRHRLCVADGARLPFDDGFFDVVISSGVLEHVGVEEHGGASYSVAPLADRDRLREGFLRELLRVTNNNGRLWLDFPNGAFPIDFWHGTDAGAARWHSLNEGFLPTVRGIRKLVRKLDSELRVKAVSPAGRLQMQQVSRHVYGRILGPAVRLFLTAMRIPGLRWLSASPFNPYLVLEISRR
ncbi:MAG: class I SAM-dependent methyltransferase [bacterium]|nr:class I SAM-dependent methyltransferase [bacterium]